MLNGSRVLLQVSGRQQIDFAKRATYLRYGCLVALEAGQLPVARLSLIAGRSPDFRFAGDVQDYAALPWRHDVGDGHTEEIISLML